MAAWRCWYLMPLLCLVSSSAWGCQLPVFRYALERWHPDLFEYVVLYRGHLSADDEQQVTALRQASATSAGGANYEVVLVDVAKPLAPDYAPLKDERLSESAARLIVRRPLADGKRTILWRGPLNAPEISQLVRSPVREELARRLMAGDAIVWLVLAGSNADETAAFVKRLEGQLTELQTRIQLPQGIGDDGVTILTRVPLAIRYSVLAVSRNDPAEKLFAEQLLTDHPELRAQNGPLLFPVFGCGRVLEALAGQDLQPQVIEDAAEFLSGHCSCEVKDASPGYDVLLAAPWEQMFDAEPETGPRVRESRTVAAAREPHYVPIPHTRPPVIPAEAGNPQAESTSSAAWVMMVVLALGAVALVFLWLRANQGSGRVAAPTRGPAPAHEQELM